MAGWPSHLDLPAREDDGTSWNKRVKAHGLSVELLDHMLQPKCFETMSGDRSVFDGLAPISQDQHLGREQYKESS